MASGYPFYSYDLILSVGFLAPSKNKLVRGLKGEAESSVIAGVLEETGWNRKAAANDLKISYKSLLYKIKQYDLAPTTRSV